LLPPAGLTTGGQIEVFGDLSLAAIPFGNPIIATTLEIAALMGLVVIALITYFRKWTYLWTEWLSSVDHKRIGVMYIVLSLVMLLRGIADAIMMRLQQILAVGNSFGYLPPGHYDQIFTAHGTIMIFFMAMTFLVGLMNIVVPLQIGARDVAFPFLNSVSFWLTAFAAALVMISLGVGEFSKATACVLALPGKAPRAVLAALDGPPLVIRHRDCGETVHAELRCEGGHRLTSARQAVAHPGPGARPRTAAHSHVQEQPVG